MSEWLSVLLLAAFFSILNSLPVISQFLANRPGFTFTGIAHFYPDYFLYLSQMSQGAAGSIIYYSHRLTNEPLPATWIWWFNGLIGYLGHLGGLTVFASYNLALLALVVILIFLWYVVARLLYPADRLSRFVFLLFMLTASSFFDLNKFLTGGMIENLGSFWFSPAIAFNRLGGVPHQVWQSILLAVLAIVYTKIQVIRDKQKVIRKTKVQFLLIACLLSLITILAATANPVTMLVFLVAAMITAAFLAVGRKRLDLPAITPFLLLTAVALPSAWVTNQAFNTVLFRTVKYWEAGQLPGITIYDFILALGPLVLFIPFGISLRLTNRNIYPSYSDLKGILRLLLISLTFTAIIIFFSPLPGILTTAPARYLSPITLSGVAILATDGFRKLLRSSNHSRAAGILLTFLSALYLFFTFFSLWDQITSKTDTVRSPLLASYLNHVPQKIVNALNFLRLQPFAPRPVVIVEPAAQLEIQNLIPVFSDKISFTGHPLHTLYGPQKEALVNDFFNNRMNPDEVKIFLNNHRIGYIITETDGTAGAYPDSLTFVKKIYNSPGIAIYKVNLP